MLQRLVVRVLSPWRELRHPALSGRVYTAPRGFEARVVPPFLILLFSLLAPPSVRAQDRSQLRAVAAVVSARPSQVALRAALRLTGARPEAQDASLVPGPQLALVRLRRPGQQGDSAVVVTIEFLHN